MPSRAMVIVGGGSSTRFGGEKLLAEVAGKPLIAHTVEAVSGDVDVCVVVCRPDQVAAVASLGLDVVIASGGRTRTLSELAGLARLEGAADLIGIHDAARPIVSARLIRELFERAAEVGGAVPLVPVDRLILDRRTHGTVTGLKRAQTPQVFRGPELMAAYAYAAREGFEGHDTVEVIARFSDIEIAAVKGSEDNIKVTFPEDLDRVRVRLTGPSRT